MKTAFPFFAFVLAALCLVPTALGQTTTFGYQGRLSDSGSLANGLYDLRFIVYDADTGGSQQGPIVTNAAVAVGNGLFTVPLDFGNVFDGSARWLEVGVRTNGSVLAYTTLSPRQLVTRTPYAIQAASAATATSATSANNFTGSLSGDVTGTQGATVVVGVGGQSAANVASGVSAANAATSANTANTIVKRDASGNFTAGTITASSFSGSGVNLASLNASQLSSGTVPAAALNNAWKRAGNSGTTPGTDFIGTTDNQPLELRVNNRRALRLGNDGSTAMGYNTTTSGGYSTAMGYGTTATGNVSTAMGALTMAGGLYSTAMGYAAQANHEGTFVWADNIVGSFASTAARQFLIRASGGVGIGTTSPLTQLHVVGSGDTQISIQSSDSGGRRWTLQSARGFNSGRFEIVDRTAGASRIAIRDNGYVGFSVATPYFPLHMASGAYCSDGGQWVSNSDRNVKENFTPVDIAAVLVKVASLPVTTWNYKSEANAIKHLGPTAQDFHAAFGLGDSDKAIGTVDEGGVALAAIQGLNQKLEERLKVKDAEIQGLRQQLNELKAALENLPARQNRGGQ